MQTVKRYKNSILTHSINSMKNNLVNNNVAQKITTSWICHLCIPFLEMITENKSFTEMNFSKYLLTERFWKILIAIVWHFDVCLFFRHITMVSPFFLISFLAEKSYWFQASNLRRWKEISIKGSHPSKHAQLGLHQFFYISIINLPTISVLKSGTIFLFITTW